MLPLASWIDQFHVDEEDKPVTQNYALNGYYFSGTLLNQM